MLLRWYSHSPNPKRLVMLARDRLCVAASPRRALSPTRADDFLTIAEFSFTEARIEPEAGQPRGLATASTAAGWIRWAAAPSTGMPPGR